MIQCLKVPNRENIEFWNYFENGDYKKDEHIMCSPIKASMHTLREHAKMNLNLVNNTALPMHTRDFMVLINWHSLHV